MMYKQSATVLALLLSSSSALKQKAARVPESVAFEGQPIGFYVQDDQNPDIGSGGQIKGVKHFVESDTSVHPTPYIRRSEPFANNGAEAHPSFAEQYDIGKNGVNGDVHYFVNDQSIVLPTAGQRSNAPFVPNGSNEKAHDPSFAQQAPKVHHKRHRHHHNKKDIGEKGVDPEVHGIVKNNNMVSPVPNWRKDTPYPKNGWHPKAHDPDFISKKDIGEKGLDPEVHGMASANNMVSPIPNWRKDTPYNNNGWDPKAHDADFFGRKAIIGTEEIDDEVRGMASEYTTGIGFAEKPRKDIGEKGVDAEVHGMVKANNMVSPIPNWRKDTPYNNNGWDPKAHDSDFIAEENPRRDIGEKGVDAEVHGMVKANNMVSPIPNWRKDTPYNNNGWDPKAHDSDFIAEENPRRDIGEKGVDAEVHGMVKANNMVSPIPNWRKDKPYENNGWDPKAHDADFMYNPNPRRDIGEKGVDAEVHGMVKANNMVSPIPNWRKDTPYNNNGWDPKAHDADFMAEENPRRDIGEKGVDAEVHGMVKANNMVSPIPNWRKDTPYNNNGWDPKAHDADFLSAPNKKRDIGEKGLDAEVHGMASANNMVSPIPNWRKDTAYPPNGWDPKAHDADFLGTPNKKRDIGEKGLDPEVHGMASANNMVSPIPNWRKDTAYPPNGWDPKAHDADFLSAPNKKKDIGEKGLDAEVHGMASANNMVSPIPNWRKDTAYPPNGWDPKAHDADFLAAPNKIKDIGEKGLDPEVHGMASANNMVSPIPNWRKDTAYPPNGWDPKAHDADFFGSYKSDVNNVNIDKGVYSVVHSAVPPYAVYRTKDAPKVYNHPWDRVEAEQAEKSFAQKNDINNKEIRPDVYQVVKKLLPAIPERTRTARPPLTFDHPWDETEYNKKIAEIDAKEDAGRMAWKKAIEKRRELEEEARQEAIEDAKDAKKAKREAEVEALTKGPAPKADGPKDKSATDAAASQKTDQQKAADAIKSEEKNTKPATQPNATTGKSDKKVAPTSKPSLKKN